MILKPFCYALPEDFNFSCKAKKSIAPSQTRFSSKVHRITHNEKPKRHRVVNRWGLNNLKVIKKAIVLITRFGKRLPPSTNILANQRSTGSPASKEREIQASFALLNYQSFRQTVATNAIVRINGTNRTLPPKFEVIADPRFTGVPAFTKRELQAAKMFDKAMTDLLVREIKKKNYKVKQNAIIKMKAARRDLLNTQRWETVSNNIHYGGNDYVSIQQPAADMKSGIKSIFPGDYNGQGVCSASSGETQHAVNLWHSSLTAKDNEGRDKTLFSGIRHATLSPYTLSPSSAARKEGARNRAKEVITAALFSRPDLLERTLKGETVPLRLTSTSLLTPLPFLTGEDKMLQDQIRVWEDIAQCNPLKLTIIDKENSPVVVSIRPEIAAFNSGVNELALKGIVLKGKKNLLYYLIPAMNRAEKDNAKALCKLLGDNLNPEADPGGWVGEYLLHNPDNTCRVWELSRQLKNIWNKNLHHRDGGEPYKFAQRISLLAYEIGAVPCWNCKSGKDRTGMLDSLLKRDIIDFHHQRLIPEPEAPLTQEKKNLLHEVLLKSGNLEIQAYNTGVKGNKALKSIRYLPFLNLSHKKVIGNEKVWKEVKGLSELA